MTRTLLLLLGTQLIVHPWVRAAGSSAASAPPPAQVTGAVQEADLTTITLTSKAEQRLGIKTVVAAKRIVPRVRTFSGELVISLAGNNGNAATSPVLGGSLDEVLRIADAQADADGRVEQAGVQLKAARIAFERAEKMLSSEAGSVRAVDETKAQVELAEAALITATERRALLGEAIGETSASASLWIKVKVYAGQLRDVDRSAPALIRSLSDGPESPGFSARPVSGPPTASPIAATVDLFYELEGSLPEFRAGERVSATLTAKDNEERRVVPWSSVLHDIHGGEWVYENTAPQTFVRRRVQVERVAGADAVLASGPGPGAEIVTDGAAELFGTEFGAGH